MAWQQIVDSDGNGATPEPYTDTDGQSTSMTVTGSHTVNYATSGTLQDNWIVGDEGNQAEFHQHTFSEPVQVLRIDLHYLNNGDAANFSYTDVNGNSQAIDIQSWIDSGDAVVNLAPDHSIQTGIPGNNAFSVIRGSTPNNGTEGGTTTIEFYFPSPVTDFVVGKNNTGTTAATDAYGYRLYYDDVASVTCFCSGTLIDTRRGQLPVEALKQGDIVRTADNSFQPIRWIGSTKISAHQLKKTPDLRPIRIRAGILGSNTPSGDLLVSPQHRILVRSKVAQRMFGIDEVLVAAKQLLGIKGIEIAKDIHEVEYFHFMFDHHEIVFSNGAETESLYTGPVALRSVSPESRKEILSLFPELGEEGFEAQPVRLLTTGRQGRRLAYIATPETNGKWFIETLISRETCKAKRPEISPGRFHS